jgi:hypothetical protein
LKILSPRFLLLTLPLLLFSAPRAASQAVPYARSYAKPRVEVEQALKEMQAYTGQKLPTLDGFVAQGDKPLDRYERGFYQFTIDLLPGDNNGTIVRLSAKITAWYADRDVTKSGYQVLPSNGRLELDFLDRLEEKFTGKPVAHAPAASGPQAPTPKLDLSSVRSEATMASPVAKSSLPPDEVSTLRNERVAAERRVKQLTDQLKNLQEIKSTQAHPQNLVIVKKSTAPVYSRPAETSRLLFQASLNDEFEFLDVDGAWIHVTISGDSRGYLRADSVDLPQRVAERLETHASPLEEKFPGFRLEREENSPFPGAWAPLKGKLVKLYTVQIVGQSPKETGAAARLNYCVALFEKAVQDTAAANPAPEGVAVIFDAADGGIVGATMPDIQKLSAGSLKRDAFWQQTYLDPPEAFAPSPTTPAPK